jgi:hypothetical protein
MNWDRQSWTPSKSNGIIGRDLDENFTFSNIRTTHTEVPNSGPYSGKNMI